jgi:hypothetical protein
VTVAPSTQRCAIRNRNGPPVEVLKIAQTSGFWAGGFADVEQAVAEMVHVLSPYDLMNWQVPAGSLDWSCWTTAAHVAHDLLAYAGQVTAHPTTAYLPFDLTITTNASPREVLQVVTVCGGLLSSAVATASPHTRAWHWGCAIPQASPQWESLRPSCTPTTSLKAWGCHGFPHNHCARQCSAVCSPMHRPVTLFRSFFGPPDERTSTATPASPRGYGTLPSPDSVFTARCFAAEPLSDASGTQAGR